MSHHIPAKGQKELDEALKAIKAKSGSLHAVSHTAPALPQAATLPHPVHASPISSLAKTSGLAKASSVFGEIDDEDDLEDAVVKHVPQGIVGSHQKREYSFRGAKNSSRGFTSSSYIQDENNTNHSRLHKPGHQYFGDKLERLQRTEEENRTKMQSDIELQNYRLELKKIRDMILAERDKCPICIPCKRKFPSQSILELHLSSEPHKIQCTRTSKS